MPSLVRSRQSAIVSITRRATTWLPGVYDSSIYWRDGAISPGRTLLLGLLLLSDFFPESVLAHESVEIEDAVQMVCFVFQRLGE